VLYAVGKSAGNIGGGWWEAEAVEAEIFVPGDDMENAVNRSFFDASIRPRMLSVSPDFVACLA